VKESALCVAQHRNCAPAFAFSSLSLTEPSQDPWVSPECDGLNHADDYGSSRGAWLHHLFPHQVGLEVFGWPHFQVVGFFLIEGG
jgi:hypothetical protein